MGVVFFIRLKVLWTCCKSVCESLTVCNKYIYIGPAIELGANVWRMNIDHPAPVLTWLDVFGACTITFIAVPSLALRNRLYDRNESYPWFIVLFNCPQPLKLRV